MSLKPAKWRASNIGKTPDTPARQVILIAEIFPPEALTWSLRLPDL
jgi:hypothetical protein